MTKYVGDDARDALFRQIEKAAENETYPLSLLQLAEAWAWVRSSNQPHGGSTQPKDS